MPANKSPEPTAVQIRAQRDRILASKIFALSNRQSAFLDYVVNAALEGRADRIKEFTLAIEVFRRDESFDPSVDSIVRVEASRLRAKLREYYAEEGLDDVVRVEIPKGRYVPVFRLAQPESSWPGAKLDSTTLLPGRGWSRALVGSLVLVLGFFSIDRLLIDRETASTPSAGLINPETTIAVLPFVNRSANQEDAFLVDGIHDDVLTQLARIGSWKVISRTSVERFRGTTQSMPDIGSILGATNIIEGGVQRAGDRIRISVQLIDAAADEHLWAETFDRELSATNIFAVQSEIAALVAEALKTSLTPSEERRLATVPTVSLAAYESFMRGRLSDLGGSATSWAEAQGHFQRAIDLDPNFALAHAGLADSYYMQLWIGTLDDQALPPLEAAVNRALELDDEIGEAYASLGHLKRRQRDYTGAEDAFERALELSPNSATTYYWYSRLMMYLDRFDEAVARARQGAELDPQSASINAWLARSLVTVGRFPEALETYEKLARIYPSRPDVNLGIAAIHWAVFGRLNDAVPWHAKALSSDPGNPLSSGLPGLLFLDLGDGARAQRLISRNLELAPDAVWSNWHMQILHAYRDDDEAGIEYGLKGLEIDEATYSLVLPVLGNVYLSSGRYTEARALFDRYVPELLSDVPPTIDLSNYAVAVTLAAVLLQTGEEQRANLLLDRSLPVLSTIPRLGTNGYGITDVKILALKGRRDEALASLREAINEGWRFLWWYSLEVDVSLDGLRADPNFQDMVAEIRSDMVVQLGQVRLMDASGELGVL